MIDSQKQFSAAVTAAVARNDIVSKTARLIAPQAFEEDRPSDAAMRIYSQARALETARKVLMEVAVLGQEALHRQLIESEVASWIALGVPPTARELLEEGVRERFVSVGKKE